MQLVDSDTDGASAVIRYERLRRGNFFADFRRDKRLQPEVYHCIVQRTGDAQILVWTQHTTLDDARASAGEHLERLSSSNSDAATVTKVKSRAAK